MRTAISAIPAAIPGRWAAGAAALLVLGTAAAGAQASEAGPCPARPFAPCAAVGDERLDGLRGGFESGGLQVAFGFERVTTINDTLVAHAAFHIPDLARITPEQAAQLGAVFGRLQLIQNGDGNVFEPPAFAGGTATVIQNTLDDQTIRQSTTIDAATNGLRFVREFNVLGTLHEALAAPLAPR